jgi:toxin ParE1/3/4
MPTKLKILWTSQAQKDLKAIFDFLYKTSQSKEISRKVVQKIKDTVNSLSTISAESGGIQTGLDSLYTYRYLVVGNYKVIYRIENQTVIIVNTIFDTRQDPSKLKV